MLIDRALQRLNLLVGARQLRLERRDLVLERLDVLGSLREQGIVRLELSILVNVSIQFSCSESAKMRLTNSRTDSLTRESEPRGMIMTYLRHWRDSRSIAARPCS